MVSDICDTLGTMLAATEVGRMLQMFRAAKIDIVEKYSVVINLERRARFDNPLQRWEKAFMAADR